MAQLPVGERGGGSRSFSLLKDADQIYTQIYSFFFASPKLPLARRFLVVSVSIIGFIVTAIMKYEQLTWLLAATAGATPLPGWGKGSVFDYPGLRFNSEGKFSITVFSDLHFGEPAQARNRPNSDNKTINVMNSVLDEEQSELVVLNGDLTSCEWVASESLESLVDSIVDPLVSRNKPWAVTFGNHDMSRTCSTGVMSERMKVRGREKGGQLSWTTGSVSGDPNRIGTSNYYIPIYSSTGGSTPKLSMILWFFDSKGGKAFDKSENGQDVSVDGFVDPEVVSWWKLTNDAIQAEVQHTLPSLVFVHIPTHVTRNFQDSGARTSTTEPGINTEAIGHQGKECEKSHEGDYTFCDGPFNKMIAETKGILGVFSGHDHGVDWCMKWHQATADTNMCFNRHSGYGGYTNWVRGARQIVLEESKIDQNMLDTWIRLEDGSISGKVTLNSTYGSDQYSPVEPKESFFNSDANDGTDMVIEEPNLEATATISS